VSLEDISVDVSLEDTSARAVPAPKRLLAGDVCGRRGKKPTKAAAVGGAGDTSWALRYEIGVNAVVVLLKVAIKKRILDIAFLLCFGPAPAVRKLLVLLLDADSTGIVLTGLAGARS
jgi:hypothetical protein